MKILFYSVYYHFKYFLRVKQAVFFNFFFPVLIFLVFGSMWGQDNNPKFISYLLSGVIAMTVSSDAIFSIGPVLNEYYSTGFIKYLTKLPQNILIYFISLIVSRLVVQIFVILNILLIIARLVFDYEVTISYYFNYLSGIILCFFIFSFLGLIVNFSGIKNFDKSGSNFIFYIILFTSDAFYPVSKYNDIIGFIGNTFPLNAILDIMRFGNYGYAVLIWLCVMPLIFIFNLSG